MTFLNKFARWHLAIAMTSNKFSLGAPTRKRPKVEMSYGKRRARRRKGAGAKAPECAIAAGSG